MSKIQIASANRTALRPVAQTGGGDTQPVPEGFTGFLPPADGAEMIVDASQKQGDQTTPRYLDLVAGMTISQNTAYRRDVSGAYSTAPGATRQYDPAYFTAIQLDALIGYGCDGTIRLKILRQSDNAVVYDQQLNCAGADDNSYNGGLAWSGPGDVYLVQVIHAAAGVVAYDGFVISR